MVGGAAVVVGGGAVVDGIQSLLWPASELDPGQKCFQSSRLPAQGISIEALQEQYCPIVPATTTHPMTMANGSLTR